MESVNERIRRLIYQKYGSQARFVRETGIRQRNVERWVSRKNPTRPDAESMETLAGYLGPEVRGDDLEMRVETLEARLDRVFATLTLPPKGNEAATEWIVRAAEIWLATRSGESNEQTI